MRVRRSTQLPARNSTAIERPLRPPSTIPVRQLILDIAATPAPTLRNFAVGRNGEVLAALARWLDGQLRASCLYLWGVSGAGKTHLLRAAVQAAAEGGAHARLCRGADLEPLLAGADAPAAGEFVAVDDVDRLDRAAQAALFALFVRAEDERPRLLLSGALAPATLPLREDLRTRIAAGLVLQVRELSDDEKIDALRAHARERGFELPLDAALHLLRHVRRDLPSLMAVLDALDEYSLRAKRPVTAALLREVLQAQRAR
jgi:DnaA family protein